MANSRFEAVTNALRYFEENRDECDLEGKIDYAFHKVASLNADCDTDTAYNDLVGLHAEKGYRDGFAAGIKFLMQTMITEWR